VSRSLVSLDPETRVARVGERLAQLNPREFSVLRQLCEAQGEVVPHAVLIERAWNPHTPIANLRVAIAHLRRKLEAEPDLPRLILAVPGEGYRLGTADDGGSDPVA
jgi:two-component system, OmpR family, KDP operon response regulator KdpE